MGRFYFTAVLIRLGLSLTETQSKLFSLKLISGWRLGDPENMRPVYINLRVHNIYETPEKRTEMVKIIFSILVDLICGKMLMV